ncbi:hypothetical protein BDZ45DRAFT_694651 [Acephala macrosclerotiorum]|nr:hypothetical protein BDZ45DRAFT_694651 [Acephala macrosclerotiorum]
MASHCNEHTMVFHLEMPSEAENWSDTSILPAIGGESGYAHLFRVMDLLNPCAPDRVGTDVVIKDALMTVLQCAARMWEQSGDSEAAVRLVMSKDFRLLLRLGVQDKLCHLFSQKCSNMNSLDATTISTQLENASLFTSIARNDARQLNIRALVVEHVASLCMKHYAALQFPCDRVETGELIIFRSYSALVSSLGVFDKSLLATQLEETFQWTDHTTEADGTNSHFSPKPLAISKEARLRISAVINHGLQQAITSAAPQLKSPQITEHDVSDWLGDFCTNERGLRKVLHLARKWNSEPLKRAEDMVFLDDESSPNFRPPEWSMLLDGISEGSSRLTIQPSSLQSGPCLSKKGMSTREKIGALPTIEEETLDQVYDHTTPFRKRVVK